MLGLLLASLAGCNSASTAIGTQKKIPLAPNLDSDSQAQPEPVPAPTSGERVLVGSAIGQPVVGDGGYYKVGSPYKILGVEYYPTVDYEHVETGVASWYGPKFHGKLTANGEIFDQEILTAAHRTLPMPSYVEVTNLANNKYIILRVNDRGPFAHDRVIDLSKRAAELLGFANEGTANVEVRILPAESLAAAEELTQQKTAAVPNSNDDITESALDDGPLLNTNDATATSDPAAGQSVEASFVAPLTELLDEIDVSLSIPKGSLDSPEYAAGTYIQVGAFLVKANVERAADALEKAGYRVEIRPAGEEFNVDGQQLYRVRIGPFAESGEVVRKKLDDFSNKGFQGSQVIVVGE